MSISDDEEEVHVGQEIGIAVTVIRAEGFDGDIIIRADALPAGTSAEPVTARRGEDSVTLMVRADGAEPGSSSDVTLVGTAGTVERTSEVNLAVLGPSGSLDLSFGILGFASEPGHRTDDARFVTGLPDGKLLVGGNPVANANVTVMMERFSSTGALDETFGKDGFSGLDLFDLAPQGSLGLAVQTPGKIIVARGGSGSGIALGRIDQDGHFDPTFAGNGSVISPTVNAVGLQAIAIGPRGEIVVAMGEGANDDNLFLARFSSDGVRDYAFAEGFVRIDMGDLNRVFELAVLPDGAVVGLFAARSEEAVSIRYLFRITPQGALDVSFSGDGVLGWEDAANPGAIRGLENGKLLVGGSRDLRPTLWRLNADGTFDSTFGTAGELPLFSDGRTGGMREFFEDSDGRLMAASGGELEASLSLIRLNETLDGVDPAFGDRGMSQIGLPPPLFFQGVASVGRGRLVVIADNDSYDFALARIFL